MYLFIIIFFHNSPCFTSFPDIVAPVFTFCPYSVSATVLEPYNINEHTPLATDNSGYVSIILSDTSELFPGEVWTTTGSVMNYWTAVDGANNTATCTTMILINRKLTLH